MNRTVVISVAIAATALLAATGLFLYFNRYQMVNTSEGAMVLDKRSGRSWLLTEDVRIEQTDYADNLVEHDTPLSELPSSELDKLEGTGTAAHGYHSGLIYNGSSWEVHQVTLLLSAHEPDGKLRWERKYEPYVGSISPYDTSDFVFKVIQSEGATIKTKLISARGKPSKVSQ